MMRFAPAALRDRLAFHLDLNDVSVRDAEEFPLDVRGYTSGACAVAVDQPSILPRSRRFARRLRRSASFHCARRCWRSASPAPVPPWRDITSSNRMTSPWRRGWCWRRARWCFRRRRNRPSRNRRRSNRWKARRIAKGRTTRSPDMDRALDEVILAAVQAALPADVLAALRAGSLGRSRSRSSGKAGRAAKIRHARPPQWRAARRVARGCQSSM